MSENSPPHDSYDYSALVSEAFKQVVKKILNRTIAEGLLGEHHFYITFETTHPQVEIPKALKLAYPAEMTIVLQHEFYDLTVADDYFSVTLLFNKQPSNLVVPYDSMRAFFDPSVDVKLFFKTNEDGIDLNADAGSNSAPLLDGASEEALVEINLDIADADDKGSGSIVGLGVQASPSENKQNKNAPVEVIMLDKFREKKAKTKAKTKDKDKDNQDE